jgi:hypothetical protein
MYLYLIQIQFKKFYYVNPFIGDADNVAMIWIIDCKQNQ